MGHFVQGIVAWYFGVMDQFGIAGIVVLMAMERSIFPVPSELVIPPAAYHACRDSTGGVPVLPLATVILAGTLGSWIGAVVTYWVARWIGRPLIVKYGKYFLLPEKKLLLADRWMVRYGAGGIFFAALLPVVRHLISIPAAIVNMRFRTFSLMTLFGAGIWCTILAIFGYVMSADMAAVITQGADTPHYQAAFQKLTLVTVAFVGVLAALYFGIVHRHAGAHAATTEDPPAPAPDAEAV